MSRYDDDGGGEEEYCDDHVCLSVCLSHKRFLCMSLVAMAWSFSGGVAIRYVLPVLWMTSCLTLICTPNRSNVPAASCAG